MLTIVAVLLLSIQASEGVVFVEEDALSAADVPNANMHHVVCNNLNNKGPATCTNAGVTEACNCGGDANSIRFSQFSDYKGQNLDLVITTLNGAYACTNCAENGNPNAATANFAKVNMAAANGAEADLKFQIVQAGTSTPVTVDYFNVAIADLDGSATQLDAEQVEIDPAATVVISEKVPPGQVSRTGNVFKSSTANVAGDNPVTPPTMNSVQLARTVIVQMQNTDHSDNIFRKYGTATRSFMFNAEVVWPEAPPEWVTTTTTEMKFGLPWWFWLLLCCLLCCCCALCCGGGAVPFLTKKKPKPAKESQPINTIVEEVITEEDEFPMATASVPMAMPMATAQYAPMATAQYAQMGAMPMASMAVPATSMAGAPMATAMVPQAY
jgi:hypothetical protein